MLKLVFYQTCDLIATEVLKSKAHRHIPLKNGFALGTQHKKHEMYMLNTRT